MYLNAVDGPYQIDQRFCITISIPVIMMCAKC